MASSLVKESLTLLTSFVQPLYKSFPASLRSHLTSSATSLQASLPHPILEQATSILANTTPETLLAILLPVLIFFFTMSSWGTRFWPSGRYSPFGSAAGHPAPTVTEDDYQYLGPDDIVDPPRQSSYGFPSSGRNATRTDGAGLSPDILVLKHRGTTYPLHFPAYAIADGHLRVGELRRLAAKETKTDNPRRIKLLYKGKVLKDDSRSCKEEGLKQNSELMCVISEALPPGLRDEDGSSESADEDEMLQNGIGGGPRIDVDGSIRGESRTKRKGHRGGRRKKGGSGVSTPTERHSGFLAPEGPSSNYSSGGSTTRSHSPNPPQPSKSQTPSEKLEGISRNFHTQFVPKCVQFMNNPPSDSKARDLEYKKLSETILAQIILKCDAVETDGDEGLRARRKELVRETQAMLNSLDAVGKR